MSLARIPSDCLLQVMSKLSVYDCLSLGCVNKSFNLSIKDDCVWRTLAERKWGHWVQQLAQVAPGNWLRYCRHRMNLESLPPSPHNLIQERFPDPWQHIVTTILCSRTNGGPVIHRAILSMLHLFPNPSAILDAPKDTVLQVLNPLGLQEARYKALKAMSRDFLEKDWKDPQEFYGCGKFVSDSWRIFCRGYRSAKDVQDPTLLRYLRWLARSESVEETLQPNPLQRAGSKAKRRSSKHSAARKKGKRSHATSPATPDGKFQCRLSQAPQRRVTRSMAQPEAQID